MEVLLICREVVGEVRNARRKYGHLNFAGTRVAFRDGEFLDYFLFVYRLVFGHFQSFVAARILGPSPEEPRPSAVPEPPSELRAFGRSFAERAATARAVSRKEERGAF